jgi:hypothetical protein
MNPVTVDSCKGCGRRKIRQIEGNAKCRHLKKLTIKGLCIGASLSQAQNLIPPPPLTHLVGSLKMNTTLEYSTRVVQEGDRRCKKSTLNDLAYLTPLRIPLMNQVIVRVFSILIRTGKGAKVEPEGTVHKAWSKIPT